MPRALLVTWNNVTGNIEVIGKPHNPIFKADSPEDLMKFVRFLSTTAPIFSEKEIISTPPLPTLTKEEIKSHPSYQQFAYPSAAYGVKRSRTDVSRETLTEALSDFNLEDFL